MSIDSDLFPPRYRDPVRVASGGMSEVFRAIDGVLDRPVAIKVLPARFAADTELRGRFRREALAAARLSGEPNTVTIFDVGEWQGRPFIVMEYLAGGTLQHVLRRGAQAPGQALTWLEQAARSLDAAHAHGVVHRDVKPGNLLLDNRGRVHVADFGIATAAGLDSLTLTGSILGTAGYLAPEQAHGRPATAATDEYALAVVAYELLTGSRPFERDSAPSEAAAHAYEPVPAASEQRDSLPRAVDDVLARALAKDPSDRFESCTAFVAALDSACSRLDEPPTRVLAAVPRDDAPTRVVAPPRRRRARLVAGAAALGVLALAGIAGALLETGGGSNRLAGTSSTRIVTNTVARSTTTSPATPPSTTTSPPAAASDASDLNTRGYRLMLAGQYSAALPLLQKAVTGLTDPSNPVTAYANFNLGQTLVRLGRCAEALPYLQQAARLEPSSQQAQSALGYAQSCAGAGSPSRVVSFGADQGGGPPSQDSPGHGADHGPGHGHGRGRAGG